MRRRNAGDEYVRSLERRVLEGDLKLVGQLARVYERLGRGLPQVDPVVIQAVELAAGIYSDQVDEGFWNAGGNGFRAAEVARIALRVLNGEEFDIQAELADAMREPEPREDDEDEYLDDPDAAHCEGCGRVLHESDPRREDQYGTTYCDSCGESRGIPEQSLDDREFSVGDVVHIDTDNADWGRLASDATVNEVGPRTLRVTTLDNRRATVTVPREDVTDIICECGHNRSMHDLDGELSIHGGEYGPCRGTGADMDPVYGIPRDETCSCVEFRRD